MVGKVVTKGGKPFQSKLAPYEAEIRDLKAGGASIRAIAAGCGIICGMEDCSRTEVDL